MSDDFAAKGGLSALSMGDDLGLLEPPGSSAPSEPARRGSLEEDLNYDDLAPDPLHQTASPRRSAPEPAPAVAMAPPAARPVHDGLIIHICRGAGDEGHLDALLHALTENGWTIDTARVEQPLPGAPGSGIEPGGAAFNDGNIHVSLGLGLGGAAAMWRGWDARLRRVDGVVAVCPFLGFDSPLSRHSAKRVGRLQAKAFALARGSRWRPIAERVECAPGYTGLGDFVSQPISWADLADCVPHVEFSQIMGHLVCPTAIILDAQDAELDAQRATSQIPAMSVMASVDVRPLADGGLLHAVEHALYQIIRYHQESPSREGSDAFTPRGDQPL